MSNIIYIAKTLKGVTEEMEGSGEFTLEMEAALKRGIKVIARSFTFALANDTIRLLASLKREMVCVVAMTMNTSRVIVDVTSFRKIYMKCDVAMTLNATGTIIRRLNTNIKAVFDFRLTWFIKTWVPMSANFDFSLKLYSFFKYTSLKQNLIALWEFDEENFPAIDSVSSYTFYKLSNTIISMNHSGKINKAIRFDSTYVGNELRASIPDALLNDITSVTLSAWIKPSELGVTSNGYTSLILSRKGGGNVSWFQFFIGLRHDFKCFSFLLGNQSRPYVFDADLGDLDIDKWYHVVGTYVFYSGEMRIYRNGILGGISEIPKDYFYEMGEGSTPLYLGGYLQAMSSYYKAMPEGTMIDQVAIWDRGLSDNEVLALYNNGNGLPYIDF